MRINWAEIIKDVKPGELKPFKWPRRREPLVYLGREGKVRRIYPEATAAPEVIEDE